MPFRVSFVRVGAYGLEIEVVCYFATKSIDEFLMLQQMANLEILKAISLAGAQLALPTSQIYHNALAPTSGTIPTRMTSAAAAGQPSNSMVVVDGKTDHLKTAPPSSVVSAVTTQQTAVTTQQQVNPSPNPVKTIITSPPSSSSAPSQPQQPQPLRTDPPKPSVATSVVGSSGSVKPMRVISLDGHDAGDLYADMQQQQQPPPLVKQRVGVSVGHAASSSSSSSKTATSSMGSTSMAAASTIQLTQAPSVSSSSSSLSAELRNNSSSTSTSSVRTTAVSSKAATSISQPIAMPNMGEWDDQALRGTSVLGRASDAVAAAVLSNEIAVAMRGRESDDAKAKTAAATAVTAASSTGSGASITNSNSISNSISPINNSSSNSASPQQQQLQDSQTAKPGQSLSSATLFAAMVASYEVTSASPMYSIDDVIDVNSNYPWHAAEERDGSWDDRKDHSIDDNDDDDDEKWIEMDTTFGEW